MRGKQPHRKRVDGKMVLRGDDSLYYLDSTIDGLDKESLPRVREAKSRKDENVSLMSLVAARQDRGSSISVPFVCIGLLTVRVLHVMFSEWVGGKKQGVMIFSAPIAERPFSLSLPACLLDGLSSMIGSSRMASRGYVKSDRRRRYSRRQSRPKALVEKHEDPSRTIRDCHEAQALARYWPT